MSRILHFETDFGAVKIRLLDTPFVDFYLEHFLKMMDRYSLIPMHGFYPYILQDEQQRVPAIIDRLLDCIDFMNTASYLKPLPEQFERSTFEKLNIETQQAMNTLHNYVVVAGEYKNRWLYDGEPIFHIEEGSAEEAELHHKANLLNQTIHALEEYIHTPHRELFRNSIETMMFHVDASQYDDCTVYEDDADADIPEAMRAYLDITDEHDVWIKKDILGKDFLTCFYDHDDPTKFEMRDPFMISGGLEIYFSKGREKIYASREFQEYLHEPLTNMHGNYPIGDVIEGKETLHANAADVRSVKFVGLEVE